MNDEPPAREPIGEDARIDALDTRLKAAKEREDQRNKPAATVESDASYQLGSKVLAELIGGIFENWDGTGHPDRLRQGQIPLRSRILRILIDYQGLLQSGAAATPVAAGTPRRSSEGESSGVGAFGGSV